MEKKALALGAERMIIENLQQEFVDELIFRAIQCTSRFRLYQHILCMGCIGGRTDTNEHRQCDLRGPVSPITPTSQAPDLVDFEQSRNFVAFAIAFL